MLVKIALYSFGEVRLWFDNNETDMDHRYASRSGISTNFAVSRGRQRLSMARLATRAQHEGEEITTYTEGVLWFLPWR